VDLNVSISNDLVEYIESELSIGRFASSSDIVAAALRLLQSQDQAIDSELARLQIAWEEGIGSGDFQPLDFTDLKAEGRRMLARE